MHLSAPRLATALTHASLKLSGLSPLLAYSRRVAPVRFHGASQFHPPRKRSATSMTTMARKPAQLTSDASPSPPPDDSKPAVSGRKRKAASIATVAKRVRKTVVHTQDNASGDKAAQPTQKTRARKVKVEQVVAGEQRVVEVDEIKKVAKRQGKQKEQDLTPLEQRTVDSKLLVGAHVSIAGGVHNAIPNLMHIGANAFALFLKNQRKWDSPDLDPNHAALFIEGCKTHNIHANDSCVPHGSYLVNLAHPDESRKAQAYKSFHDDLTRCHILGIQYYNFHPGNFSATTRDNGIQLIAEAINKAHEDPATGQVVPLLETMATLGNTIGGTFQDLADIISHVKDKSRVGVCLDTCHIFAAGYDLRSPEAYSSTMKEFDEVIGLKFLKALHVNDSKAPLASYRDLHANIGTGYLGLRSFHNLVNDERIHGLPMILETPIDTKDANGKKKEDKSIWAREIKLLEQLVGMDAESEQFRILEEELEQAGVSERERIGDQVKRKKARDLAPKTKTKAKKEEAESSDSEG